MNISENQKAKFQEKIVRFYWENGREFPWRNTSNEFHGLVAEIMLQRTPAERVEPFYEGFVSEYKEPEDVLDAELQMFEELGLNKREEWIKEAAKFFLSDKEVNQENLLNVKGIGLYTANAFLSIHKNVPLPIVDTNVKRALEENFEIDDSSPPGSNSELWSLAKHLLPEETPREFNLGLLDYGNSLRN